MATNQTSVALDLAGKIVTEAGNLMNTIEESQAIYDWRTSAEIDFEDYEGDIAASESLKHVEGGYLNKVSGAVMTNLINYLQTTNLVGGVLDGKSYWEALQLTRRNGGE